MESTLYGNGLDTQGLIKNVFGDAKKKKVRNRHLENKKNLKKKNRHATLKLPKLPKVKSTITVKYYTNFDETICGEISYYMKSHLNPFTGLGKQKNAYNV